MLANNTTAANGQRTVSCLGSNNANLQGPGQPQIGRPASDYRVASVSPDGVRQRQAAPASLRRPRTISDGHRFPQEGLVIFRRPRIGECPVQNSSSDGTNLLRKSKVALDSPGRLKRPWTDFESLLLSGTVSDSPYGPWTASGGPGGLRFQVWPWKSEPWTGSDAHGQPEI